MPHVFIRYTDPYRKVPESDFLKVVKEAVRHQAPTELSVPGLYITGRDFGFTCQMAGSHDELIHDLEVIIFAHADKERLLKDSDQMAEAIGLAIKSGIRNLSTQWVGETGGEITFSVSVFMGQMGYSAGSAIYGDHVQIAS